MTIHCEQRAIYGLDLHLPVAKTTFARERNVVFERRTKPRSNDRLPVRVWGVDIDDHPFSYECLLDNISASGVYLRIPRKMEFSSVLSLVVRLPNGPFEGMSAAIKGTVIRDEMDTDGHRGIGIRIIEHEFI